MNTFLIATIVTLLIVFAVSMTVLLLRARRTQRSLFECQNKLDNYSDIREAGRDLEEIRTHKGKLEAEIRRYQSALGKFTSVAKLQTHIKRLQAVVGRYESVAELDAKIEQQRAEIQINGKALEVAADAKEIISKARYYENLVSELEAEVESLEETKDVQQFGFYRPQYDFEHSAAYKAALDEVVEQRKQMIKVGTAIYIPPGITIGGDERAGKRLGEEYAKVMLRAFNGESDANLAKAKYNNMKMLQKRMEKSRERINKLGDTMQISISEDYLKLRLQELHLAYEWERKKQQEKEEQAFLREQAREEEKARREAEKARREAEMQEEQEEQRLAEKEALLAELRKELEDRKLDLERDVALTNEEQERLKSQLAARENEIANLESQRETLITAVKEAHDKRERAVSLAEMTKRGHVYILSNIGSFRENWFKIGMTRREDPNDRVKELASASVPFPFDIHAMILTDDAPRLENALHAHFADRRVNRVNNRKEFFEVSIDEIEAALETVCPSKIEFRETAEAAEYRETVAMLREEERRICPGNVSDRLGVSSPS